MSVTELAARLKVSEVTIRQDLSQLSEQGFLKRRHGFAEALDQDDPDVRMQANFATKVGLARHAAALVADGETVFIEGGSANALLARELANRSQVTVITVSHYIAHLLRDGDCTVVLLGGQLQKGSESLVGPLTRRSLDWVYFSKAFIGIDGYTPQSGFTSRDMMRADIVHAVLAKGADNIVLSDASKFGQLAPNPLDPDGMIVRVITDAGIDSGLARALRERGLTLDLIG